MKTIVIMPGGFHPFHAGHYALYKSAVEAFPNADMYVAATNDTSTRPFPFEIKERLAKLAGVKPGQFVQVKSPFQAKEITNNYNAEEDIVIFVRSEKDRDENPKPGGTKKDGSPAYFQPYTGKNMQPFGKHAYFAYLPTVEFGPGIKSATEIRNAWPRLNDDQKLTMVYSLYPKTQKNKKLAQTVVGMLDQGMDGQVSEGLLGSGKKPRNQTHDRLSGMSYDDLRKAHRYYKKRLSGASHEGSLVQGALSDYVNTIGREITRRERDGNLDENFSRVVPINECKVAVDWSEFSFIENMDARLSVVSAYLLHHANLTESNDPDMTDYFLSLADMSSELVEDQTYLIVPLALVNNSPVLIHAPESGKLLGYDSGNYELIRANRNKESYPIAEERGPVSFITLLLSDLQSYEKLVTAMKLKFDVTMPAVDGRLVQSMDEQVSEEINPALKYDLNDEEDRIDREQRMKKVSAVMLRGLSPREEYVIRARHGLGIEEQTLEQIANTFGVRRERVRQLEARAMRKLKHMTKPGYTPKPRKNKDMGVIYESEKTGVDYVKDRDPLHRDILRFAKRHYPEMPDLQSAFVKYVIRSLKHSEEDSEEQSEEISELKGRIEELEDKINELVSAVNVTESTDYISEK